MFTIDIVNTTNEMIIDQLLKSLKTLNYIAFLISYLIYSCFYFLNVLNKHERRENQVCAKYFLTERRYF